MFVDQRAALTKQLGRGKPATGSSDLPDGSIQRGDRRAVFVLLALMAGYAAALMALGSGHTFYADEWGFVLRRGGWSPEVLLSPNTQHLSLIPVLAYKAMLAVFGLDRYWGFQLVGITAHLGCIWLVFTYARARTGDWPAAAGAAILLGLGFAWEDILWPFQLAWMISLAAGTGVLLCLDRRTRRGDIAACALVATSLASSGIGLPFTAGITVNLLLRRDWRSRIWVTGIPLLLIAIWSALYEHDPGIAAGALPLIPGWIAGSAAAVSGALVGLGAGFGSAVLALALLALAWQLGYRRQLNARAIGLITAILSFWAVSGAARALTHAPTQSRYLYPAALLAILLAAESLRNTRFAWPAILTIWAVAAFSMLGNLQPMLTDARMTLSGNARLAEAELTAVELARQRVPELFKPDWTHMPSVQAGVYLEAVRRHGSPALTETALMTKSPAIRMRADDVSQRALVVSPKAATGAVASHRECAVLQRGRATVFRNRPGGAVISATGSAATVRLRRFAPGFDPRSHPHVIDAGRTALIVIPPDLSTRPWFVSITTAGTGRVCVSGR